MAHETALTSLNLTQCILRKASRPLSPKSLQNQDQSPSVSTSLPFSATSVSATEPARGLETFPNPPMQKPGTGR